MANADNDNSIKAMDSDAPMASSMITSDGVLVAAFSGGVDYRDVVEDVTHRYRVPGELVSVGICAGVLKNHGTGLLLGIQYKGEGNKIERVEVGRIGYAALVRVMASVVAQMHELDLLKYEPGGEHLSALLTAEARNHNTAH